MEQKPISKKFKKEKSTSTKGHYVTNAQILEAFHEAKAQGKLTDKLAKCLIAIAEKYSYHPWFNRYSYREDMVASAIVNLCANWHKFDPEKTSNPFSYYTTSCYRSFQAYKEAEYRQRDIKDELLIDAGANPSFNFTGETSDETSFSIE